MIKVTIYRTESDFTRAFKLVGHAGQAEHGKDIVCAAVSGLAQSIIGSLQEIVGVKPQYSLEPGRIYCEIEEKALDDTRRIQADTLMRAVEIGVRQIRESYGRQFISVDVKREAS